MNLDAPFLLFSLPHKDLSKLNTNYLEGSNSYTVWATICSEVNIFTIDILYNIPIWTYIEANYITFPRVGETQTIIFFKCD